MLYMIYLADRDGQDAARAEHLQTHIAHFRKHAPIIALSGPLSGEDGKTVGSLVILDVAGEQEARDFIRGDPYYGAGVWHEPVIACFRAGMSAPDKLAPQKLG